MHRSSKLLARALPKTIYEAGASSQKLVAGFGISQSADLRSPV